MRDYVRTLGSKVVAALGFLGILVTILGWAIPTLRDWLGAHPGLGWTAAAVFAVLLAVVYLLDDSAIQELNSQQATTVENLKSQHATALQKLVTERDNLRAERDDLEARLHPTNHDVEFFESVIRFLPWDEGLIGWLVNVFNAKRWRRSECEPLWHFNGAWENTYFDDHVVQEAYGELRTATYDLAGWLAAEGAPDDSYGGTDTVYTILGGDARRGGWPDFDACRKVGQQKARAVVRQRKEFERVGRSRGLTIPVTPISP